MTTDELLHIDSSSYHRSFVRLGDTITISVLAVKASCSWIRFECKHLQKAPYAFSLSELQGIAVIYRFVRNQGQFLQKLSCPNGGRNFQGMYSKKLNVLTTAIEKIARKMSTYYGIVVGASVKAGSSALSPWRRRRSVCDSRTSPALRYRCSSLSGSEVNLVRVSSMCILLRGEVCRLRAPLLNLGRPHRIVGGPHVFCH